MPTVTVRKKKPDEEKKEKVVKTTKSTPKHPDRFKGGVKKGGFGKPGDPLLDTEGRVTGIIGAKGNPQIGGGINAAQEGRKALGQSPIIESEAQRAHAAGNIAEAQNARAEAFKAASGSAQLRAELEEAIANQPDLKPRGLTDVAADKSSLIRSELGSPLGIGGGSLSQAQRLLLDPEGEFKKIGIKATAGALLGLSIPYVAQLFAQGKAAQGITGNKGSVTGLHSATTALGIYLVGNNVFDYRGDKMDTFRTSLTSIVEDGERLEAATRNGYPTTDTVKLLSTMNDEVIDAERVIRELGNYNLAYRVSEEYIEDQTEARSAREALLRRLLAVENLAATGQAALSPEEMLYEIGEI